MHLAFSLPKQSLSFPDEGEFSKTDRPRPLRNVKILVVDDSDDSLNLLKIVLSRAGADVIPAVDGKQALELIKTNNIDLIISDINMPIMNGYEFLQNTRKIEQRCGRQLRPAIALTAFSTERDRSMAYQAGYNLHLVKPVRPQSLVDQILQIWNEWKGTQC
jgi:CheY-like chemotaxis protein